MIKNNFTRYFPIIFLIIADFICVNLSVYLAASVFYQFISFLNLFFYYSILFFAVSFPIYYLFKNYTYLNRSFSLINVRQLLTASFIILILIFSISKIFELMELVFFFYDVNIFSFKNILNQVIIFCLLTIVTRLISDKLSNIIFNPKNSAGITQTASSYVIYGAGSTGLSYLDLISRNTVMKPSFIIDDNPSKIGRFIQNIKIISFGEFENNILNNKINISKILFCIPSLESIKIDKIKEKVLNLNIDFDVLEVKTDSESINNILTKIKLNSKNIKTQINSEFESYFKNKSVLVTGAGGSIGKEICYQVSKFGISKLVAIDMDEYRLSIINRELNQNFEKENKKYTNYLLDINNYDLLLKVFNKEKPDIVYHAAAFKHVDLVEQNWLHASINNIKSTYNVCKISLKENVKKIIFISTDKAVEPINFLGLSKSVGEKITQTFGKVSLNNSFSVVRFGNVVGSSGSLLDTIKHQLEVSNKIKVTDKNMTRYFMTISDAVNLVLISSKISNSGDCHVLKMGEPVKILDIVKSIVDQHNATSLGSNQKIEIEFSGIRPGEKISEKLFDEKRVIKTSNEFILNEKNSSNLDIESVEKFVNDIQIKNWEKENFKNYLLNFSS
jgi:FlaA1/EpsC-like NDP-sugar epimerase